MRSRFDWAEVPPFQMYFTPAKALYCNGLSAQDFVRRRLMRGSDAKTTLITLSLTGNLCHFADGNPYQSHTESQDRIALDTLEKETRDRVTVWRSGGCINSDGNIDWRTRNQTIFCRGDRFRFMGKLIGLFGVSSVKNESTFT